MGQLLQRVIQLVHLSSTFTPSTTNNKEVPTTPTTVSNDHNNNNQSQNQSHKKQYSQKIPPLITDDQNLNNLQSKLQIDTAFLATMVIGLDATLPSLTTNSFAQPINEILLNQIQLVETQLQP